FFSSRGRHTRSKRDWSSDVCSSDLYLGIHPWEVLHVGLYEMFGLSIGQWSIIIGVILIIITLLLDRQYIHIGTFLNVFFVGWSVDLILWLDFLPHAHHLIIYMMLIIRS